MKKAVVTILPNCRMFAVRPWITTSPYRIPVGSLPSTCMLCSFVLPRTALKTFTPRRYQLVICGQYIPCFLATECLLVLELYGCQLFHSSNNCPYVTVTGEVYVDWVEEVESKRTYLCNCNFI
jgi:hypothetical protein